jgi:hypothetical protein
MGDSKLSKTKPQEFFTIENVRVRAATAIASARMAASAAEIVRLATAIQRKATLDLIEIATSSPVLRPAAPVVAASPSSEPMQYNINVNEMCSRAADTGGPHGERRRIFRERRKEKSIARQD